VRLSFPNKLRLSLSNRASLRLRFGGRVNFRRRFGVDGRLGRDVATRFEFCAGLCLGAWLDLDGRLGHRFSGRLDFRRRLRLGALLGPWFRQLGDRFRGLRRPAISLVDPYLRGRLGYDIAGWYAFSAGLRFASCLSLCFAGRHEPSAGVRCGDRLRPCFGLCFCGRLGQCFSCGRLGLRLGKRLNLGRLLGTWSYSLSIVEVPRLVGALSLSHQFGLGGRLRLVLGGRLGL
jgi:hypothetical protein